MLIDGEKWACEACVRGHRVSNCNHNDRPLTHINKKGRPVSQCPHCRGLRKSRSTHVKCECGERSYGKGEYGQNGIDLNVEPRSCSCMHGMRCTCALKKEHLDPVPELPISSLTRARSNTDTRKPRLSATYSDPSLMVFTNGHHKPAHRHNHASHDCAPYKIPRPHSIHGHSEFGQKSMDSLLYRPTENYFPHSSDSFANIKQEERLVRSAQGSPGLQPVSRFEQFHLPQLDIPFPVYNTSITSSPVADDYAGQQFALFDQYAASNEEPAPSSTPLSMPTVDWHASDLPLSTGNYSSTFSQPPSYASFDQGGLSRPGLTASSSGEVSEADEYGTRGVSSPGIINGSPYPTSLGEQGTLGSYNLSNDSFSSMASPPLLSAGISSAGMDPFLQRPMASPADLSEFGAGNEVEPDLFTRHGITVQEAQKLAHAGSRSEAMSSDAVHAIPRPTSDPLWASAYTKDEGNYSPANGFHDGSWVS